MLGEAAAEIVRGLGRDDETLLCARVHEREPGSVYKEACMAKIRDTTLPFSPQDAHLSEVNAVCFGPNSSLLATGGADRLIHLWNVVGGEGPSPVGQPNAFSADPTLSLFRGGQKSWTSLCFLTWMMGQWPSSLGKSVGHTFLKKDRTFQLLGSSHAG